MPRDSGRTHSMLRGPGGQRAERTELDTGTGVKRIADERRGAHIKRGMFVNKQEDIGLNTTEAHATLIRKEEKDFQSKVKQDEQSIGKAQSSYDTGMSQIEKAYTDINKTKIPSVKDTLNSAWKTAEKDFVTVRFVSGSEIIRSQKMPADAVKEYQGKKGIWATYVDGGKYFNVEMKERHHTQQLAHDSVKAAERAKAEWMVKKTPEAKKAYEKSLKEKNDAIAQVKSKEEEFHKAGTEIASAKGQLKGAKETRAAMWKDIRGQQAKKIATMKEIFLKLKVDDNGGDDNGSTEIDDGATSTTKTPSHLLALQHAEGVAESAREKWVADRTPEAKEAYDKSMRDRDIALQRAKEKEAEIQRVSSAGQLRGVEYAEAAKKREEEERIRQRESSNNNRDFQ